MQCPKTEDHEVRARTDVGPETVKPARGIGYERQLDYADSNKQATP